MEETQLTRDDALFVVEARLARANADDDVDLRVDHERIRETARHWLICCNTAQYFVTGDPQHALLGNNCYAICKTSGKIDHDYDTDITELEP